MSDYSEEIERAPVIFFLGAGASVALGKPTTLGFWEQLKDNPLAPKEAYELLLQLEKDVGGAKPIDIEVILDSLQDWELEADKLAQHPVSKKLGIIQESLSDNLARQTHQAILSRVIDTYSEVNHNDAYSLWGPIFEEIWALNIRTLPIFTTNYDTVIEQAVLFSDDILRSDKVAAKYEASDSKEYQHLTPERYLTLRDGFSSAHREFARWDHWDFHGYHEDEAKLAVTLFKLHGSVTWSFIDLEEHEERIGDRLYRRLDGDVGLVPPEAGRNPLGRTTAIHYPYLSKSVPSHDIYDVAYNYFRSCLMFCKLCVAVGSSFRDEKVVEAIIESALMKTIEPTRKKRRKQGWKEIPIRHEGNKLKILTVAPEPDHFILQKMLKDHPKNPPIEVIPCEGKFDKDTTPAVMDSIKQLLAE